METLRIDVINSGYWKHCGHCVVSSSYNIYHHGSAREGGEETMRNIFRSVSRGGAHACWLGPCIQAKEEVLTINRCVLVEEGVLKLDKCIHQVREVLCVHFLHVRGVHVVGGPG